MILTNDLFEDRLTNDVTVNNINAEGIDCPSKYKKEKQWKSRKSSQLPATFYSTAKNIFSTAIKYLTKLLTTYTIYTSNLPILSCWNKLCTLWATFQYQCDHFLQPHTVKCASKYRKEKQWKSIVIYKPYFLFFNDHPKDIWLNLLMRPLHSATNLNEI